MGYVRDDSLGQTYAVLRRESDGEIVRRWIAPDSPLALIVPWDDVNSKYTFPVLVIVTIPLDEKRPHPNQLVRRFDGGDDRILSYDADLLAVAARAGPGHVPGAGVLLVRRDGGGCGLLRPDPYRDSPPHHHRAGPGRLPQLPAIERWSVARDQWDEGCWRSDLLLPMLSERERSRREVGR